MFRRSPPRADRRIGTVAVFVVAVLMTALTAPLGYAAGPSLRDSDKAGSGDRASGKVALPPKVPAQELLRVEKQLEEKRDLEKTLRRKAEELGIELDSLQDDLVKTARSAQDAEESVSSLENRLAELKAKEATLNDQLHGRDDQMVQILIGLERMALRPPEAILVQPGTPHEVVRGALVMRSTVPELQTRVEKLRADLDDLGKIRADIALRRVEIAAAAVKLDRQQKKLATLVERKKSLVSSTMQERENAEKRVTELAQNAESLRDLMAKIEAERRAREEEARRLAALVMPKPNAPRRSTVPSPPPETLAPSETSPSRTLPVPPDASPEVAESSGAMPARGTVVVRYGDTVYGEDYGGAVGGGASKGIVVQTRANAQVVAPAKGRVAFSGPFRGYGQLLILEHPGGYHCLLAGFARLDAVVGQDVVSGEPVGIMGASGTPKLYIELRRNGQPVNPLPWLSSHKG